MMAAASFLEARVRVTREQVAAVEALMNGQGAMAVTLAEIGDHPVLEPAVGETPLWPEVEVRGLFEPGTPAERLRAVISLAPGVESRDRVALGPIADRDWVRAWMDRFGPLQFGHGLWIVPTHCQAPDPEATIVRLDPGLAFGTGTHPSTRLCLEWIDGADLRSARVVDFGCGSGILGIAAALRGAREVLAVDNDPQALLATAENARRNGMGDVIRTVAAEEFEALAADVVLANILAGTLIELAPVLGALVRPGGALVLAGILEAQAAAVAAAYADRFPAMQATPLEGWVCLSGRAAEAAGG